MPLSVMSALMLIVAHASGFIRDLGLVKRSSVHITIAFLIAIMFARGYSLDISPELTLNAASLLFAFNAILSYSSEKKPVSDTFLILAISFALSIVFHIIFAILDTDAAFLACGLIVSAAYAVFRESKGSLLLICALASIVFELQKSFLSIVRYGYIYFELSTSSLDLMMICSLFIGFASGISNWSMERNTELEPKH